VQTRARACDHGATVLGLGAASLGPLCSIGVPCDTSALVIVALFNSQATTNAIQLKAEFNDDLVKDLAEQINKDAESGEELTQVQETPTKEEPKKEEVKAAAKKEEPKKLQEKKDDPKVVAKPDAKKDAKKDDKAKAALPEKKEEEDIPMDSAAIKAYSSVIADAAEDSEPSKPVIYTETMQEEPAERIAVPTGVDAMGSMIQNEISSIKEATIKAAQESSD